MSPELFRAVFLALMTGLVARAVIGALNVDIDYRLSYDDRACLNYYEMREVFMGVQTGRQCYEFDEWRFVETEGAGWDPSMRGVCVQADKRQVELGIRDLHCEHSGVSELVDYYAVRDVRSGEMVTIQKRDFR